MQAPTWFVDELRLINPDLRIIWGRDPDCHELAGGCSRWLIQHRPSLEAHHEMLELMESRHEERFVDQKLVNAADEIIGERQIDRATPWITIHFVEVPGTNRDDDAGYRPPDRRDLDFFRQWEWNRRDLEAKFRRDHDAWMVEREKREAEVDYGGDFMTHEQRRLWRGDAFVDIGRNQT